MCIRLPAYTSTNSSSPRAKGQRPTLARLVLITSKGAFNASFNHPSWPYGGDRKAHQRPILSLPIASTYSAHKLTLKSKNFVRKADKGSPGPSFIFTALDSEWPHYHWSLVVWIGRRSTIKVVHICRFRLCLGPSLAFYCNRTLTAVTWKTLALHSCFQTIMAYLNFNRRFH